MRLGDAHVVPVTRLPLVDVQTPTFEPTVETVIEVGVAAVMVHEGVPFPPVMMLFGRVPVIV
jgi:hypothetical protein